MGRLRATIAVWAPHQVRGIGRGAGQAGMGLADGVGLDVDGFASVSGWAGEFDRRSDGFCGNLFFCGLRLDDLLLWTGDRRNGGFNL